ncbi:hypothetical protein EDD16DRAFT_299918 [Pisolithus croceorrhizus]|nr:hypothetical protein EDD16DRAFT_299918 [Pisolithus croceorrhizus]
MILDSLIVLMCQPTREGRTAAAAHLGLRTSSSEWTGGHHSPLASFYCALFFFYEYIALRVPHMSIRQLCAFVIPHLADLISRRPLIRPSRKLGLWMYSAIPFEWHTFRCSGPNTSEDIMVLKQAGSIILFGKYLRIGWAVSHVSTFSQLSLHVAITSRSFVEFHPVVPHRRDAILPPPTPFRS